MKRFQLLTIAGALSIASAGFAGPVTVDFASTHSVRGLDSFSGSAVYDSTTDRLTLDITNTSKAPLTAFAFDTEAGDVAKYERASKKSPWKNEPNKKDVVNARPFGKYDAGAAIGGTWGSLSHKGIAAGATVQFVFDITGPNASNMTTTDFFSDTSKPQIVATFSGLRHHKPDRAEGTGHAVITDSVTPGGSDAPILHVDPPVVVIPPILPVTPPSKIGTGGVSSVPLPAAAPAGLAMLGVFGIARFVRRLRAKVG